LNHPLDQDQPLHQGQHLQVEAAVGVGQHVKLLQIVMVMPTVGLAKSSVPDLVPVCGARRHLSEGWAFFISMRLILRALYFDGICPKAGLSSLQCV
jgi:hypothetical protein